MIRQATQADVHAPDRANPVAQAEGLAGLVDTETLRLFGKRVRDERIAGGMTQADLAKAASLKQPDVARIEKGEGNPTLAKLERLAAAVGKPLHSLLAP